MYEKYNKKKKHKAKEFMLENHNGERASQRSKKEGQWNDNYK